MKYANITATIALVLSMGGGAYAASRYVITSTSQIKPSVLAHLHSTRTVERVGPTGPEGSPGRTGLEYVTNVPVPGPVGVGVTGARGATGAEGENGHSVQGPSGHGFVWEGAWIAGRSYDGNWRVQAIVQDSGKAWICVAPEPGCDFGTSDESPSQDKLKQWELFAE